MRGPTQELWSGGSVRPFSRMVSSTAPATSRFPVLEPVEFTAEARKVEQDRIPSPTDKKRGEPAQVILHLCSNILESAVGTVADIYRIWALRWG